MSTLGDRGSRGIATEDWYGLDIYDFNEGQFRDSPDGGISAAYVTPL